jgi:hypothetical protein
MIRLDRQSHKVPLILFCHVFNDGFKPIMNWPYQHLTPSLRTKDDGRGYDARCAVREHIDLPG